MAEEKEEVKDAEKEQPPKKSKLKLIIIAMVVLLIGAGGFIGYSKYKKGKAAKAEAKTTEKVSIICPLKSFVVNLLDKKGVGKKQFATFPKQSKQWIIYHVNYSTTPFFLSTKLQ